MVRTPVGTFLTPSAYPQAPSDGPHTSRVIVGAAKGNMTIWWPRRGSIDIDARQPWGMERAMRIYEYAAMTEEERRVVLRRSTATIFSRENLDGIQAIYDEVRRDGDAALVRLLQQFDRS